MKPLLSIFLTLAIAEGRIASAADETLPGRFGKVIAKSGTATLVKPDGGSREIQVGDELPAGSVLKTTDESTVDLFFRRIGTIFQLQPKTVLSLDKLEMEMKAGKVIKRTELSLKEGGALACIRVLIPDSKVIIRAPEVIFHVPGTGMGRYEFRADGSVLVGKKSKLSVVADANKEPVSVAPGEFFSLKSGHAVLANPSLLETFSQKMDRLQNTATQLTPPPASEEIP